MAKKVKLPRNYIAVSAHHRHAGPMKHRNAPQEGGRNDTADIMNELADEYGDEHLLLNSILDREMLYDVNATNEEIAAIIVKEDIRTSLMSGEYEQVDQFLSAVDLTRITPLVMYSILVITTLPGLLASQALGIKHINLPSHPAFYVRVQAELTRLGKSEIEISNLIGGLK